MPTVLVSGSIHDDDLALVRPEGELTLLRHRPLSPRMDPAALARDLRRADLSIVRLTGQDPEEWLAWARTRPELEPLLASPSLPLVLWTQDSHRMGSVERRVQGSFRRIYTAHRSCLPLFDTTEARWLPVGYSAGTVENLRMLRSVPWPHLADISLAFDPRPEGNRNRVVLEIARRLDRRGLRRPFGRYEGERRGFGGSGNMKWALLTAPVALNVSHSGDLNLRTFEALALDRALLTTGQEDMASLGLPLEHVHPFRRDLSDFDEALELALASGRREIASGEVILRKHMKIHRYLELINRELGTALIVELPATPPPAPPPSLDRESDVRANRAVQVFSMDDLEGFAHTKVSME